MNGRDSEKGFPTNPGPDRPLKVNKRTKKKESVRRRIGTA